MSENPTHGLSRRELGWKALAVAGLLKLRALSVAAFEVAPTPSTGYGPFYPVDDTQPADGDLTLVAGQSERAHGQPLRVVGHVLTTDGTPIPRAEIVVWQTDSAGRYDHPQAPAMIADPDEPYDLEPTFQYWGRMTVNDEGRYELRTVVPGYYKLRGRFRPRHIHFKVAGEDYKAIGTEMHFAGDPHAAGDFVTDLATHQLLAVEMSDEPGGKLATFDVVLRRS